jgi:hypothetical protein
MLLKRASVALALTTAAITVVWAASDPQPGVEPPVNREGLFMLRRLICPFHGI